MPDACSRRRRVGALLAASLAHLLGLAGPVGGQEAQGGGGGGTEPSGHAPDDRGVVHSWALAPGDGSQDSGARPNLSYELPPGGKADDVVTLYNYSNVALTFDLYATDAFNNEDGSFDLLASDKKPKGVGTWFTLPAPTVTVPAGKLATFPITITVPPDARPGDHAGGLLAASRAAGTSPDGDVVTLDRRTGSRVYVRVEGPLQPGLSVQEVSTTYAPALDPASGAAVVRYRIANTGNVSMEATHRASVAGPFGLLRRSAAKETVRELLPGESVDFVRKFDDVPATVLAFAKIDVDPQPVNGGADDAAAAGASAFAFAIPFTVLAAAVVFGLVRFARRSYRRHQGIAPVAGAAG